MKYRTLAALLALLMLSGTLAGCSSSTQSEDTEDATTSEEIAEETTETAEETTDEAEDENATASSDANLLQDAEIDMSEPGVYLNYHMLDLSETGEVELDMLSVENGITITVVKEDDEEIQVNGEVVDDSIYLDITSITDEDIIYLQITQNGLVSYYFIYLLPSTFPSYTTEGESATSGDYYMSTYALNTNYIFKVDNSGNLIYYKETGLEALDFRKEYNSAGAVRYTYLQYIEESFCGISGINPGCVVIMDENYFVIDEVYYLNTDGTSNMIDPHGFIYLDDNHYILTSYQDQVVTDVPEDLGMVDESVYLAVLYMEEVQNGEILWEFCSLDEQRFLYATTDVYWGISSEECYDYMHFNSMFIDNDDNLVVSCRNINSIIKVSRETGELIWILGGSEDDFGLTDDQLFSKQHSIIVTSDGSYMIFNNGNDEVGKGLTDSSSIIRLKVDEQSMTVTEFLSYDTEFFSNYMGSIRQLDGENGIYLWAVGGNYLGLVPDYTVVEYSETDGAYFIFYFNEGGRRMYCANKCE